MFGGFDGSFFNDVNLLDIESSNRSCIKVEPSEICKDYLSLVNNPDSADVVISINDPKQPKVFAHRGFMLFRLMSFEVNMDDKDCIPLLSIFAQQAQSEVLKKLINASHSSQPVELCLKQVTDSQVVISLLEYLYCNQFMTPVTLKQFQKIGELCTLLGLKRTLEKVKRIESYGKAKVESIAQREHQMSLQEGASVRTATL